MIFRKKIPAPLFQIFQTAAVVKRHLPPHFLHPCCLCGRHSVKSSALLQHHLIPKQPEKILRNPAVSQFPVRYGLIRNIIFQREFLPVHTGQPANLYQLPLFLFSLILFSRHLFPRFFFFFHHCAPPIFKYAIGVLAPDRAAALAAFHCAVVASAGGYTSVGCPPPTEAGTPY